MTERRDNLTPEVEGVIFLITKDDNVLLEKRTNPERTYFGSVIIPGGHVETTTGESHKEALIREVREECGIEIEETVLLDTFYNVIASKQLCYSSAFLITKYTGDVIDVEPENSNHLWVPFEEATKMVSFVESKYILLLAKQHLRGQNR